MRETSPHAVAVMSALRFSDAQPEALRNLTDVEWKELLPLCDEMQLTIPLRWVCGDALPMWVCDRIDHNIRDNAERQARLKRVYLELADALNAAGVEHVVLKGFAHIPDFVDTAQHRMQSDIDLYCPPEKIRRAGDALAAIGYEPYLGFEHQPIDHLPTMMRPTTWTWSGDYFDHEMPVSVDLHFRFWNERETQLRVQDVDQFWNRRGPHQIGDFGFPALAVVDRLGYSTLHVFHHLMGGVTPSHIYELANFLNTRAHDREFWTQWRDLHAGSLRRIEAVCFQLAIRSFGCKVSEEAQTEINRLPIPVKQWFCRYPVSPLATVMQPNKDALWLHLGMLESYRQKLPVFCKGLFPVRIPPLSSLRQWSWREYGRFFRHATSRVSYHVRTLPRAIWESLRWHRSANGLGRQFWILFAASTLFDIGLFIFFFLYNLFLLDFGYNEKFLGQVTSSNAVGGVVGAVLAAVFAHRFGLRRTILACLALVTLFAAALALFVSVVPQLCFAFLASAASTIFSVCVTPAVAQLTTEQNRSLGFSVISSTGIGIGTVAGIAGGALPRWLTRAMPAATAGGLKQAALLISCAIVALGLWPAARLRLGSAPALERKIYPRSPFMFRFLIAVGVWSLAAGAFTPFFNAYCSQHLRMPLGQIGMVFSGAQLTSMIAMLAAPLLFRKVGLITGIVYTQIAAAVLLGWFAATSTMSGASVLYMGYAAFLWMSEPGMSTLLMNKVDPSERSGASAMFLLVLSLAGALVAPLAGASFARYGYPVVLVAVAGVTLAGACAFRVLLGRETETVSQPSAVVQAGS